MKIACTAALLALLSVSTEAFTSSSQTQRQSTHLNAVVTGVKGKAAASREEDLMLTLQVIMDHQQRSSTVSKEQYVQQMEEAKKEPEAKIDVSVPYDAAARLAYEASDKSVTFEEFEVKYLAEAVELVKSKRPVDVSIPYDAAAKLAYEAAGKPGDFASFHKTYLAETVEMVKSKQSKPEAKKSAPASAGKVDISVPYDAAAMLAYQAAGKPGDFASYKTKYLAEAVELVKSKQKK
jgi:hypothetical protein